METTPILILVNGLPCTGKTTIAKEVSKRLGYPLITKDSIKEVLFDHFGYSSRSWSKKLSLATYEIMFTQAKSMVKSGYSLVLEANFPRKLTEEKINKLGDPRNFILLELWCVTDPDTLLVRFKTRSISNSRHPGHLDSIVFYELQELTKKGEDGHLGLGGAIIKINTTDYSQVDFPSIINNIQDYIPEYHQSVKDLD